MPMEPQLRKGDYFIDPESGAELARLMYQDHLITKGMDGVLPEQPDISSMHTILDIACGPGGWVLDLHLRIPRLRW